jgi:hypothetical protein
VTTQFESLARSISAFEGYPDLPLVVVPHPFTTLSKPEVEELADEFAEEILSRLASDPGPASGGGERGG